MSRIAHILQNARTHPNKAVVVLATKMARVVWAVFNEPGAPYERCDPDFASTL